MFVLVAGPPGSGKSTLAVPLASELRLPLLAKDSIKAALIDAIGWPASVEQSRMLGRAAVFAMFAVARANPGAVLDSTFYEYTVPLVKALPGPVVEVRCRVPQSIARRRYRTRTVGRDSRHFENERTQDELWESHQKVLGFGPVIEVDTTATVDVPLLARRVTAAAMSGSK